MAKGAGMIEPNMATMLGFLTTDADVGPDLLQRALAEAADDTFNAITVDGETSTNDMVLLLAGGRSGVRIDDTAYSVFVDALHTVCRELALAVVTGAKVPPSWSRSPSPARAQPPRPSRPRARSPTPRW